MKSSLIRTSELTMKDLERMYLRVGALAARSSEGSRGSEVDPTSHSVMLTKFSESSLEEEIHSNRSLMKTMILCMQDSAILAKCPR